MLRYILKRTYLALITAFIILSATFILMKILPFQMPPFSNENEKYSFFSHQLFLGYVEKFAMEQTTMGDLLMKVRNPSTQKYEYYYRVPILKEYFLWIKNIFLYNDWGVSTSIKPNISATSIILERLPVSVYLNLISVFISVPIGVILGIVAALKKNKPTDHAISTFVMVFISIPSFVLIVFLKLFFGYKLGWVPPAWPKPTDFLSERIKGFILPVVCLSFGSICGYCRMTRAELCEVMSSEYLLLARTKGLTKKQAIIRHALRNAMVPIVPMIIAEFIGSFFGGSMILENLYSIPGIGSLFINALNRKDYNVLFVDMAIFTTIGLLAGVLIDISYGFIDPRIRMGARK